MSDIRLTGRAGPVYLPSGTHQEIRLAQNAEAVVAQGKGAMAEASMQSQIFIASNAVAGVAPGTALSTTPPFSLWNPAGSNRLVSILKVSVGYVSGTLGAGTLAYAQVTDAAAPTGGTDLVPVCAKLGISDVGVSKVGTGHTVDATPTIIRPSGINFGAFLATTATISPVLSDNVNGEITVGEGKTFVVEGIAAGGSSPLIIISVTYQEIPTA